MTTSTSSGKRRRTTSGAASATAQAMMTGVDGASTWARGTTKARAVTAASAASAAARMTSATSGWRRSATTMRPRFIEAESNQHTAAAASAPRPKPAPPKDGARRNPPPARSALGRTDNSGRRPMSTEPTASYGLGDRRHQREASNPPEPEALATGGTGPKEEQ